MNFYFISASSFKYEREPSNLRIRGEGEGGGIYSKTRMCSVWLINSVLPPHDQGSQHKPNPGIDMYPPRAGSEAGQARTNRVCGGMYGVCEKGGYCIPVKQPKKKRTRIRKLNLGGQFSGWLAGLRKSMPNRPLQLHCSPPPSPSPVPALSLFIFSGPQKINRAIVTGMVMVPADLSHPNPFFQYICARGSIWLVVDASSCAHPRIESGRRIRRKKKKSLSLSA